MLPASAARARTRVWPALTDWPSLASHRNTRPAQGSVITVETSHADARDADDAPADTTRCSDSRERAASEYMADETAGNESLTVICSTKKESRAPRGRRACCSGARPRARAAGCGDSASGAVRHYARPSRIGSSVLAAVSLF